MRTTDDDTCCFLWLLRHGEASFHAATDKARILTTQGLLDCQQVGEKLSLFADNCNAPLPEHIVASPYQRTQQTLNAVLQGLNYSPSSYVSEKLTPNTNVEDALLMLEGQFNANCNLRSMMIVSHQPLVSYLQAYLVDGDMRQAFNFPMAPASLSLLTLPFLAAGLADVRRVWHSPYGY